MSKIRCDRRRAGVAGAFALAGAASMATAGEVVPDQHIRSRPLDPAVAAVDAGDIGALLGVRDGVLIQFDADPELLGNIRVSFDLPGIAYDIDLERHSIRDPGYQVLVDVGNGVLERAEPGPVRTYQGSRDGEPGSDVRASLEIDGLHVMLRHADGDQLWIQPVTHLLDSENPVHLVYSDSDILPHDGQCGGPDGRAARDFGNGHVDFGTPTEGAGTLCTAQLACDADVEYFNDYGSVGAVESRINNIVNVVNNQYENEVDITHLITTIIVRTSNPDPYTSNDAQTLLCQFITEWSNNQGGIQRDLAHLFTGRNLNGGTIGIAADIGATGICQNNGSCTGGQFGTQGSYCLAESDFNGNFGCATDLTAHEMGHLWGAFHCSCNNFTMNPFITCANDFTNGSVSSITAYRATRTCLDCAGFPPANDSCLNAEILASNATRTFDTTDATPPSGVDDSQLPAGSPSCQWDGDPDAAHNTVWFRFTATDSSVEIETCTTADVDDTFITLYQGNCGAGLVEVACGEDECGNRSRICVGGLEPGTQYTIVIGNPGSWAGSQPGEIRLDVTTPCPEIGTELGACCVAGGTCYGETVASECAILGGTFLGIGTTCDSVDCTDPTGACCVESSGDCVVLDPGLCELIGGTFAGFGSSCDDIECGNPCPADFDNDGTVGFTDLLSLLAAWGPCPDCPQDLDDSGAVDFADILTLLASWGPCS